MGTMVKPDTLGARLAAARTTAGLNQEAVAQRLGTSRVLVSKWENDVHVPGSENLRKLAELYDLDMATLLSGDEPAPSDARVSRGTANGTEGRAAGDTWQPDPRYAKDYPPRAYQVALAYCRRLEEAGLAPEEIADAERLMLDNRYAKMNSRAGRPLTEDDLVRLIDATWDAIREVATWKGRLV